MKACKPVLKKLTFVSLGVGFLALTSSLSAENSGFYGSVGFQYSNMTRAEATNGGGVIAPSSIANNYFHNQAGQSVQTQNANAQTYQDPNASATLGASCSGPNCGN
ncbi:hypothetical protein [Helicobacter heilmannii]|uniref:hypothetical protein n=1 Tax=Helicobacter heilmannii TaxID=35817 RepID=UPI001B32E103|nr:hypothetical protein [Helicobacter heilmannii]